MTTIFGNHYQQQALKSLFDDSISNVISVVGLSGIGKHSFIINELHGRICDLDLYVADNTIDAAREAISLFFVSSLYSPFRALVVDGADHLSEPAQDAYLKLFEEPFNNLKIILICNDDLWLSEPLYSRVTHRVVWNPLTEQHMLDFINAESLSLNKPALQLCNGRPGLYREIAGNPSYLELQKIITDAIIGVSNPLKNSTPSVIKNITSKSTIEREIVVQLCSISVREASKVTLNVKTALSFLNFASILKQNPTVNAEIYWNKACCSML